MKDFNDFLATVTPEVVAQICEDANLKAAQIRSASEPAEMLSNQIGAISLTFSLELLGLYHKWIEKEP